MRHTHKAIDEALKAITEIAEVVRELDPGRVATYDRIEQALADARGHLARAKAFE
jgi:alkylated DNA nucleotide flippase Atl1